MTALGDLKGQTKTQFISWHFPAETGTRGWGSAFPSPTQEPALPSLGPHLPPRPLVPVADVCRAPAICPPLSTSVTEQRGQPEVLCEVTCELRPARWAPDRGEGGGGGPQAGGLESV